MKVTILAIVLVCAALCYSSPYKDEGKEMSELL